MCLLKSVVMMMQLIRPIRSLAPCFRYKAVNSGIVDIVKDPKAFYVNTTPAAFGTQAKMICGFTEAEMAEFGPKHAVRPADIPFQCLDITYAYQLLVTGLGFHSKQVIHEIPNQTGQDKAGLLIDQYLLCYKKQPPSV